MSRILKGVLAGICGTIAMTAVMRRLHRRLPSRYRYPLPPREIMEKIVPAASESDLRQLTTLSHFEFGAAAGALFALVAPRRGGAAGMAYGAGVWAASYLGWIPGARILTPATHHPRERNALMIAAHLVWGAVMALSVRELDQAEQSIFSKGDAAELSDRTPSHAQPFSKE
jgi:hypothetical protein